MPEPAAFYNEIDPGAADWLRALIDAGQIAPGIVSETPIQELCPDDLARHTQVHLFAGIGGWSLAARLAGWPDDRPLWTGSAPCQPFSSAGARRGKADPRHLWPHMRQLIATCRPPVCAGEQVASPGGRGWLAGVRRDLGRMGYQLGAANLPAASVAAPHQRSRLWWVATRLAVADADRWRRIGRAQDVRSGQPSAEPGRDLESVADIESGRLGEPWPSSRLPGRPSERDGACSMADASSVRHERQLQVRAAARTARGVGADDAMGVSHSSRAGRHAIASDCKEERHADAWGAARGQRDTARTSSAAGALAHPAGQRPEAIGSHRQRLETAWDGAVVLTLSDGSHRRAPPEPGFQPLAHGIPADLGLLRELLGGVDEATARAIRDGARRSRRVRLRGYGNAIVPQVGALFLRAFIEARGDLLETGT